MFDKTYEGCAYEGGFEGMLPSEKARLILDGDLVMVRRPRAWGKTHTKVWAKWSAVTRFDARPADGGTRVLITTKKLGTGTFLLHAVDPAEVWRLLDSEENLRERIPEDVRTALDDDLPVPERDLMQHEEGAEGVDGHAGDVEGEDLDDREPTDEDSRADEDGTDGVEPEDADESGEEPA